jgi:cytochrome b561
VTPALQRYHGVAMSLHWLIALCIIFNLIMGLLFDLIPRPERIWWIQLHKSIGIVVLGLTCIRIFWRLTQGVPPEPASLKRWEVVASNAVHFLLYVLMFAIPFSGWLLVSSSPLHLPTFLFWTIPWPNLPFFENVSDLRAVSHQMRDLHKYLAYGMIALLGMHVGAALRHHWILKDEVIMRMTPRFLEGFLRFLRGEKA